MDRIINYKIWDIRLYLSVIVLIQLLLSFQGFDVCDEGFSLTFYQQFFNAPESVEYVFVYWFSGFFGGIWYQLFPEGGILWFRLLAVICNTASFFIAYKLLSPYLQKPTILMGLTMALFVNNYGYLLFYHNQLSILFILVAFYFLLRGLERKRLWFLFLSGCVLGAGVFVRIPNLFMLLVVLAIPLYHVLNGGVIKDGLKQFVISLGGIISGVAIVAALLFGLGQFNIMMDALSSLVQLGETADSGHSFSTLVRYYFNDLKKVASVIGYVAILSGAWLFLSGLSKKTAQFYQWLQFIILVVLFFLLFKGTDIYAVYALISIGLIGTLFLRQAFVGRHVVVFLALCMLYFMPLGSGGAIHSAGTMGVWLGLPLMVDTFYHLLQKPIKGNLRLGELNIDWSSIKLSYVIWALVSGFFLYKVIAISHEAYFDKGNRFQKTASIQSQFAKGIVTTDFRADIINDLLFHLKEYVQPNDYLLAYDNIPMIHVFTETKPYMYNPWVWIYDSANFKNKLEKAEREIAEKPVVVQQKFNTIGAFGDPVTDYMKENQPNSMRYNALRTKEMNDFLERNHYEIAWSNDYFVIYRPK